MYSKEKEHNTVIWNDGSIADDLSIKELNIHDLTLKTMGYLFINKNNNL